ncbi:MAG: tetratricopeptide repeat protein [Anaerolineae bacterium]|nr:tetratricopeptide repeat protein [Anaerolineae bacterium]
MSLWRAPQVGLQPALLSAGDEQLLLAAPHLEDDVDLFAADPDPDIRRLGRLALRRVPSQAADYFALGDLCAQRAYEGERLNILYVAKALQAYKRAGRLASQPTDQALAGVAQANLAAWIVNVAHSTPSPNNIGVALWAVAEVSLERLDAESRAAALELAQWYAAALRAVAPPQTAYAETVPSDWLERDEELLEDDETTETKIELNTAWQLGRTGAPEITRSELVSEFDLASSDFQRGDLIGERYRVRDILEGGMGIVYICLDEHSDTFVALKTFQARFLNDETSKQRFEHEAWLWVEMDKHPNIVRAYKVASFGKSHASERPHIILEYVRGAADLGSDLRGWIKHKRLTPQLSLEIALGVCNGMLHAVTKKEGFVHRDLKPGNILVRHDGVAKVTDFGLGRARDSFTEVQGVPSLSTESQRLDDRRFTQPGKVAGTLAYMAPEQYTPSLQPLDARADIFAFGIILYEMLTGIQPFSGARSIQALRELHSRPVRFPPELAEQLPADLCDLILRCLKPRREARPQTWLELRTELAQCYQALTGNPPPLEDSPVALERDELMDKAYSLSELKRHQEALSVYDQALALDPNSAWIWARKGRVLRQVKRYDEALATFERALALKPDFAWAWYNKGIVYERLKQYDQAQAAYKRAAALNPRDIWATYNHARLLLQLGQPEAALEQIQSALAIDPEHALSHVLRGHILMRLAQVHEALAAFERALQLDRELGEAFVGRGKALKALRRHSEAISTFLKASRLLPKDFSVWLSLADIYLISGNLPQALTALEQAKRLHPESASVWLRLGRIHLHHNRPAEALNAYEQVLQRHAQHITALTGKSLALLALRQYNEAVDALQAVLKQRPDDFITLVRLGTAYLRNGEAANALDAFDRALQQRSDQAWLWTRRAFALERLARYDEAVSAWQRALTLKPAQTWYQVQLAALQARRGQLAEALSLLEPVNTAEAHALRATVLRRLKRYPEALEACDRALSLAPEYAKAHNERGILLERLGQASQALEAFEQALHYAPHVTRYRLNVLNLLHRLGKHEEALRVCVESLAALPANSQRAAQLWTQHGESLRRLHRHAEALDSYAKARELAPQLPLAWEGEGLAYAALGRRAEALQSLKRATELHSRNARFWYNLGEVLIEDGNYPEAIRALNQALALKPDYSRAELKRREARQKLKNRQQ